VRGTISRLSSFAPVLPSFETSIISLAYVCACSYWFLPVYWTVVGHDQFHGVSAIARTIRDQRLDSKEARKKLKPSGKPYWRLLDEGVHFGYRKGQSGGKWVVRLYKGNQQYVVETIGNADDGASDADGVSILSFAHGQARARSLAELRRKGIATTPTPAAAAESVYRVGDCIADYLDWMQHSRKSAADARYRANRIILPTLGELACIDLSTELIQKWLRHEAKSAARIRSKKGKEGEVVKQRTKAVPTDPEAQRKRRASSNRTLTILKAALNRAWREGKIASDAAWRRVEPFEEADAARVRYLTIAEAQRLINTSAADFRLLVRAALATGARYGELASLRVSDFNSDSGTLHIRTSKSGKGRHIVLADEGVALFASQAAGRLSNAPLLSKEDGGEWKAAHQARPMKAACKAARIEPEANFHCLRHTYASHAIMNGAPLLVVAKNLGHSDTRMVERHYGHLAPSYIADAIRAAAPKFGTPEGNVEPFATRAGAGR
jgi:integrase